jgi:hypothetical protein
MLEEGGERALRGVKHPSVQHCDAIACYRKTYIDIGTICLMNPVPFASLDITDITLFSGDLIRRHTATLRSP